MSWFATVAACVSGGMKVTLPPEIQVTSTQVFSNTESSTFYQTITTTKTEYRALSKAAADSAITAATHFAAIQAHSPKTRELGAGGYTVCISVDTATVWET